MSSNYDAAAIEVLTGLTPCASVPACIPTPLVPITSPKR